MTSGALWLKRILGKSPSQDALVLAGEGHREQGRLLEARALFEKALSGDPEHAPALLGLGRVAEAELRYDAAIDCFRRAALLDPGGAQAHLRLAMALAAAGLYADAAAAFQEGLARQPHDAALLAGYARTLIQLGRLDEAWSALERARALEPRRAEVHYAVAHICLERGDVDAALEALRRAVDLAPGDAKMRSGLLFTLNYAAGVRPRELFAEHRRFGDRFAQAVAAPPPDRAWPRRLRVGYVSPDFRSHVVATFMLPILARHDRASFEVFCYYLHPEADRITEGIIELADHWRDCARLPDAQVAARIREDRIDVLVDLAGHTNGNRLAVFALRPAPLQLSYLGYPNTTGLPALDYRLTDARADPPGEADELHTERLIRLPRTFVCYRPGPGTEVGPLPARANGFVTFGSLNNVLKLSPAFLACVAKVLQAVPGSRLLVKDRTFGLAANADAMRRRLAAHGIDGSRLLLRGWEPTAEGHLGTYAAVDIALDSFPYNGTTTTCEALWMGVPVVTLLGERHAGRVGASLLQSVGLERLVAKSEEEYVRAAAGLAADLVGLAGLRAGMRELMRASPLMDEAGFVRDYEQALVTAWQERLRETVGPKPDDDAGLKDLWNRCHETGSPGRAVAALGEAMGARGERAEYRYMLGCTLQDAGRLDEAAQAFARALELDGSHAKAANNLGAVREALGAFSDAEAAYSRAIVADAQLALAHANRGNLRKAQGRFDEAEADLARAVDLEPGNGAWLGSLADCLAARGKLDEALARHRAALALDPAQALVHYGLANTLLKLGEPEEAATHYREALERAPDLHEAHSSYLLCLHYHHGDEPEKLRLAHQEWARRHAGTVVALPQGSRGKRAPLRIGYVSPDFRSHPVAVFLEPLLAARDRERFHVTCYSTALAADSVTRRFAGLADRWRDIRNLTDDAAAEAIRSDGIDILVDLAGHTADARPLVFARRPAPVSVAWLGYPDTTGLQTVDYRLTDGWTDPPGLTEAQWVEKLVRLPDGFLCFSAPPDVPVAEAPCLARGRITFASFNNLAKVSPRTVKLWSAVLASIPESRLVLKAHALKAESARRRVLDRFADHGIGAGRIELLGPEAGAAAHLARYGAVDIALDTFPYHGTTTTCEALWMGVPVVTLAGRTHVSRVGVSLLSQVGLEDLVAASDDGYVAIAQRLASDARRLNELRKEMRRRMRGSSLMDARAFARKIEAAYLDMWRSDAAAPGPARAPAPVPVVEAGALRLHIGGRQRKPGWKILNAQEGPEVDYVGDCADLARFADGSVEEIYASHVLEHLGYQSHLPRALKEFHRVLRPGGTARISVPDFEKLCRMFLDPSARIEERFHCMRMAFGGQVDEFDFHRVGLTHEFLSQYLRHAGFSRVERVERFGLFDDASSLEVRGELISLNVVAYK